MGFWKWLSVKKQVDSTPPPPPCQQHSDKLEDLQTQLDTLKIDFAKLMLNRRTQVEAFNGALYDIREDIEKIKKVMNSDVASLEPVAPAMQQSKSVQQDPSKKKSPPRNPPLKKS